MKKLNIKCFFLFYFDFQRKCPTYFVKATIVFCLHFGPKTFCFYLSDWRQICEVFQFSFSLILLFKWCFAYFFKKILNEFVAVLALIHCCRSKYSATILQLRPHEHFMILIRKTYNESCKVPSLHMFLILSVYIFKIYFYTLLIEGILVLSIRVGRIEILIWGPRFLGDIWSAWNSKTFELCLSVRPSVHSNPYRATNFKLCKQVSISHRPFGMENRLHRSTGYGTSHINQTRIPASWARGKSNSHQI